jgi:hypothetical protein
MTAQKGAALARHNEMKVHITGAAILFRENHPAQPQRLPCQSSSRRFFLGMGLLLPAVVPQAVNSAEQARDQVVS